MIIKATATDETREYRIIRTMTSRRQLCSMSTLKKQGKEAQPLKRVVKGRHHNAMVSSLVLMKSTMLYKVLLLHTPQ